MYKIIEQALKSKKASTFKPVSNKRLIKRAPKMRPPLSVERDYMRELWAMVAEQGKATMQELIPQLPAIIEDYRKIHPNKRVDNYSDLISSAMKKTRIAFNKEYTQEMMRETAGKIGIKTAYYSKTQMTKVLSGMIGVDIFIPEDWQESILKGFVEKNVALIKTIPERYFANVENLVYRDVEKGLRSSEIAKDIMSDELASSKWNATRIARDQVNKFNGKLNQERQEAIGLNSYIWRTAGDNRVRDSHEEREGQTFQWDDPPEGGHPGEDIMCRCSAEPDIAGVLEELGI